MVAALLSIPATAQTKRLFKLDDIGKFQDVRDAQCSPDGKSVAYPIAENGVDNVWIQPLDGGPGRQITHFNSDQIYVFHWSPDGKELGVLRGHTDSDVVLLQESKP